MYDQAVSLTAQDPTKALLQLCKRLERAWTLPDILTALTPVVDSVLGYPHTWLGLMGAQPGYVNIISHAAATSGHEVLQAKAKALEIPIAGDRMLEEIMTADHVVVVVDARTDPRTNKNLVEQLQNRTIVNVPLLLADERLGALGMGTYGDEGIRPPSDWQIDFMQAMAGHVAVALDRVRFIQAHKQAEDALYQEKERLQVTLHSISDGVITTNAQGELQYINPIAEDLTGWSLVASVGKPYRDVFVAQLGNDDISSHVDMVTEAVTTGQTLRYHHLDLFHREHGHFVVEAAASPIRDADGDVQGAVLVFRDVTERHRLSQEIAFQATHDELTGLGNRRAFEQALGQHFETTRQQARHHVVCYLDLDEFKVVNDTCGHTAGDELLRQIAQMFKQLLHSDDHLCRLGGDEFGIILSNLSIAQALGVAERLQQHLADYRFVWRDQRFSVGVSIGMVALNPQSESVGALLQAADSACYVAKESGRGRIHVYANDDQALAQRYGVMEWVSRIEHALLHNRFVLYAQPIVPMTQTPLAQGLHCEFLLRMLDDAGQTIMPGQFMPAVERYHLASRVDRWVLTHALEWLEQHQDLIGLCSINLSGQSLGDEVFISYVLDTLSRISLAREKLCFEVTETAAISNLQTAKHFIDALHQLGCKLSLDDFGSGLSSFAYLRNLPVDVLKIDGQFVRDIAHDAVSLAMVKSIHDIGCLMNKETVAEFAESPAILEHLHDLGVHYAQGYAVGHPMPLEQLLQWHKQSGSSSPQAEIRGF